MKITEIFTRKLHFSIHTSLYKQEFNNISGWQQISSMQGSRLMKSSRKYLLRLDKKKLNLLRAVWLDVLNSFVRQPKFFVQLTFTLLRIQHDLVGLPAICWLVLDRIHYIFISGGCNLYSSEFFSSRADFQTIVLNTPST